MTRSRYREDVFRAPSARVDRRSIDRSKRSDPKSRQQCQWPIWLPATNADVVVWSVVTGFALVAIYLSRRCVRVSGFLPRDSGMPLD